MKIALGQLNLYWEDKERNLDKVERCMELLAGKRADALFLPEMSLTGFSMHTDRTKESGCETVTRARMLAEKHQMILGIGWVKDAGELCENHYSIVGPEGELMDYAKLHPFRYGGEAEYFRGGSELSLCRCHDLIVGVQICYDLRFPEPFQKLSRTADLILVPANWPEDRREHWNCLLRARAIENMSYVAGINCAGNMGGQYYSGDSALYAPDGRRVRARTYRLTDSCPEERLLVCEVKNDVYRYRSIFPVKDDRREALYDQL